MEIIWNRNNMEWNGLVMNGMEWKTRGFLACTVWLDQL